jgi:uncharacterized sulfatase
MRTIKNYHCLLLLTFFLFHLQTVQSQVKPKYNVLFIAIDDMNDRVDFLGSPEVPAPNIQRLLKQGMLFKYAYTQFPICSPSRTAILTGWRPDKTGVFNNGTRPRDVLSSTVKFLPEYFKQHGYRIERYGKIMHTSFENDITWDYAEPKESGGSELSIQFVTDKKFLPAASWWVTDIIYDSLLDDGKRARHLVNRLKQPQTQPFFYALGLISPHYTFTPSLKYLNKNGDPTTKELLPKDVNGTMDNSFKGNGSKNIVLPLTPANDRDDVPSIAFSNFSKSVIKPDSEWRRTIHAYDAEVSQMDAQLGRVLDELDRQHLWDNTIVVFWSDHGQHLGEHLGLWRKQTLFEESLHTLSLFVYRGKKEAEHVQDLLNLKIYTLPY